jgi:hypothetical protein
MGKYNALGGLSVLFKRYRSSKAAALAEIAIGSAIGLINGLDIAQKSAKVRTRCCICLPIFYATQVAAVFGAVSRASYLVLMLVQVLLRWCGGGGVTLPTAPNVQFQTHNHKFQILYKVLHKHEITNQ